MVGWVVLIFCYLIHDDIYVALLLPFTKVGTQMDQLHKYFLGKSYEMTLVIEILAKKW